MDLRQMEYAVAIADELNFTRAAARCSIGQSGLSHQIAELEREVGTRLFDRTSRSVQVTPAGQTFVACARRVLKTIREMRLDDAQALLPLALAYRLPAPTSPPAQAFLHLALDRLLPEGTTEAGLRDSAAPTAAQPDCSVPSNHR